MEKRDFSRVPFKIEVIIITAGEQFKGFLEDISLQGMCIISDAKVVIDEEVTVEIRLNDIDSDFIVDAKGIVKRVSQGTVGLKITKIDLDSFVHIKNIIKYNSTDPGKMACELSEYIQKSNV